ncbi:MAG: tetratricopeptide repeat protein [Candidatus Aureabacteria bacterium]|nr:tetratricopeptide repeat protein [Candidatus Auribacterota bacterium]
MIACSFLIVLIFAVFGKILYHTPINYDLYMEHPVVRSGLNSHSLFWAFTTGIDGNWIPLTWLSHLIMIQLFGTEMFYHFGLNLILHMGNTLILYLLFQKMTGDDWISFLVAAIFAIHPLHVESVAWLAERKGLLSSFFSLFACLFYCSESQNRKHILSGLFFFLALMAKPSAVVLPIIFLLLDFWPLQRWQKQRYKLLFLEKIHFFIFALIFTGITYYFQFQAGAKVERAWDARMLNIFQSYGLYIIKILVPYPLIPFYPFCITKLFLIESIIFGPLIVWILFWLWKQKKRFPMIFWGGWVYVIFLLPVCGIIPFGTQSMADRYMYLPLIGISAAWIGALPKLWLKIVMPFFIFLWSLLSLMQADHWRDSITLWRHTLQYSPSNSLAHSCLASIYHEQKKILSAWRHWGYILPDGYPSKEFYFHLGLYFHRLGIKKEAKRYYLLAIKRKERYAEALNNLGLLFKEEGKLDDAEKYFKHCIQASSECYEAYFNLGDLYFLQGKYSEALSQLKMARFYNPYLAEARQNIYFLESRIPHSACQS